jgi:hypothetical protein
LTSGDNELHIKITWESRTGREQKESIPVDDLAIEVQEKNLL